MLFLEHVPLLAEAVYPIWLESYYTEARASAHVSRVPLQSQNADPDAVPPHTALATAFPLALRLRARASRVAASPVLLSGSQSRTLFASRLTRLYAVVYTELN
jgi:hypothetical protein